jgi:F-type H+-transporting ATPase subunit alpha
LSVSRVGFSAAIKAVKQVGSTLKLDLAQYRELAAFSQFGSDLDKVTQNQLNRGKRLVELLKQDLFQPLTPEHMVAILFAGTQGLLDDVKVEDIRLFEGGFHKYLDSSQAALMQDIAEKKALDDDLRGRLKAAIDEYKKDFLAEHEQAKGKDAIAALSADEKKKAAQKTDAAAPAGAAK